MSSRGAKLALRLVPASFIGRTRPRRSCRAALRCLPGPGRQSVLLRVGLLGITLFLVRKFGGTSICCVQHCMPLPSDRLHAWTERSVLLPIRGFSISPSTSARALRVGACRTINAWSSCCAHRCPVFDAGVLQQVDQPPLARQIPQGQAPSGFPAHRLKSQVLGMDDYEVDSFIETESCLN